MHFPVGFDELDAATLRLAFDELLALQIGMVARRRQRQTEQSMSVAVTESRYRSSVRAVEAVIGGQVSARRGGDQADVRLTTDQQAALEAIRADLAGDGR